jgi:hypothetical protein
VTGSALANWFRKRPAGKTVGHAVPAPDEKAIVS